MRAGWLVLLVVVACKNAETEPTTPDTDDGVPTATCTPADEVCDGLDNDCDGEVDEGLPASGFADVDGDGFGDPDAPAACGEVGVADPSDCDDGDAAVHPGATETCDGKDTDCTDGVAELVVPDAYPTVQGAIDAAVAGDVVCVRPGTWDPIVFRGVDIEVTSIAGPETTILDGGGAARVVAISQGEGPGAHLHGFTLTNGRAPEGAGLTVAGDTSPTLDDLVITGNTGFGDPCHGAGLLVADGAHPTVRDVVVSNNVADQALIGFGGGIGVVDATVVFEDVTVTDNSVDVGQIAGLASGMGVALFGDSDVTLRRATIARNQNTGETPNYATGGGVFVQEPARLTLENSVIADNVVSGLNAWGAGLAIGGQLYAPLVGIDIANVHFANNRAEGAPNAFGGAIYGVFGDLAVTNSSFVQNYAGGGFYGQGGAIYIQFGQLDAENDVFDGNVADGSSLAEGGALFLDNHVAPYGTIDATYNAFFANSEPANSGFTDPRGLYGNIDADPAWVDVTGADATAWDLHPTAAALVDAGDASILDPDGSRSDLGGYGGPLGDAW